MPTGDYVGRELELFSAAKNWKSYLAAVLAPYLEGAVLEVGAGSGGTTEYLCAASGARWVCLEPDPALAAGLAARVVRRELPARCSVVNGSIADIPPGEQFGAVIYVDVLEHVGEDARELGRAAELLAPGGRLVVLSPAHQWLFSEFDREIGHFRRYDRKSLSAAAPPGLRLLRLDYLDSAGMIASMANRLALRQSMPTRGQIAVWDGVLVPVSRVIDPLLGYRLGKSILAVWQKD